MDIKASINENKILNWPESTAECNHVPVGGGNWVFAIPRVCFAPFSGSKKAAAHIEVSFTGGGTVSPLSL
jgi:hypothetical protein